MSTVKAPAVEVIALPEPSSMRMYFDSFTAMMNRITGTHEQPVQTPPAKDENGRSVIIKSFRVQDSDLFCKALRFKAATTYAAYKARNGAFDEFIDMLNTLGE